MHKEIRQVGAVGALILLLLGPSLGKLFHVHETSHLVCMHEGGIHFHDTDSHSTACFLCSFSFSSLPDKKEASVYPHGFKNWNRSPSFYLENFHYPILSSDHSPRAPPFLLALDSHY